MKAVLLRHGIAVDPMDPLSPPDDERPLTPKGERRTRAAVEGLRALRVRPGVIFTSPLLRARQTANIAARALGCKDVRETPALGCGIRTRDVFDLLRTLDSESVLLVGHAPQLDLFLSQSLGHDRPAISRLKKAGAACLDFHIVAPSGGDLVWFIAPRGLRRLAAH